MDEPLRLLGAHGHGLPHLEDGPQGGGHGAKVDPSRAWGLSPQGLNEVQSQRAAPHPLAVVPSLPAQISLFEAGARSVSTSCSCPSLCRGTALNEMLPKCPTSYQRTDLKQALDVHTMLLTIPVSLSRNDLFPWLAPSRPLRRHAHLVQPRCWLPSLEQDALPQLEGVSHSLNELHPSSRVASWVSLNELLGFPLGVADMF